MEQGQSLWVYACFPLHANSVPLSSRHMPGLVAVGADSMTKAGWSDPLLLAQAAQGRNRFNWEQGFARGKTRGYKRRGYKRRG